MPGKTPNNGKKPLENGVQQKKDSSKAKGKKAAKDGDEEMTVVVPPSKSSKKSTQAPADAEGDVAMDEEEEETKVDPVVQTVAGEQPLEMDTVREAAIANLYPPAQISRATLPC